MTSTLVTEIATLNLATDGDHDDGASGGCATTMTVPVVVVAFNKQQR